MENGRCRGAALFFSPLATERLCEEPHDGVGANWSEWLPCQTGINVGGAGFRLQFNCGANYVFTLKQLLMYSVVLRIHAR